MLIITQSLLRTAVLCYLTKHGVVLAPLGPTIPCVALLADGTGWSENTNSALLRWALSLPKIHSNQVRAVLLASYCLQPIYRTLVFLVVSIEKTLCKLTQSINFI